MKRLLSLGLPALALALCLALASCGGGDGGGAGDAQRLNAAAENFREVFDSVKETHGDYIITLTSDLLDFPGISLRTEGVNITVRGNSSSRKITWGYADNQPPIFIVEAGKLTLENLNLSRSAGNTRDWPLININGGTVEMKNGVTISSNNGTDFFEGVYLNNNSTFIMSGGTFEDCRTAIGTNASGAKITITGGIIRNNRDCGVGIWDEASGASLTMSGGTISGNVRRGIAVRGTGNTVTISGGTISGHTSENPRGYAIVLQGSGNTVNMSGGELKGNFRGVDLYAESGAASITFNMSGGSINGNINRGVNLYDNGRFIMSGGSIGGNSGWGVSMGGANTQFEKRSGGTIYGNSAGSNSNTSGAVDIWLSDNNPANTRVRGNMASSAVYAARTNAAGTAIVAGSLVGDWE